VIHVGAHGLPRAVPVSVGERGDDGVVLPDVLRAVPLGVRQRRRGNVPREAAIDLVDHPRQHGVVGDSADTGVKVVIGRGGHRRARLSYGLSQHIVLLAQPADVGRGQAGRRPPRG